MFYPKKVIESLERSYTQKCLDCSELLYYAMKAYHIPWEVEFSSSMQATAPIFHHKVLRDYVDDESSVVLCQ